MKNYTLTNNQKNYIRQSERLDAFEMRTFLDEVTQLYETTYSRIWDYLEIATANHDLNEMEKQMRVVRTLRKEKEKIDWAWTKLMAGKCSDNFILIFQKMEETQMRLINNF